MTRILTWIRWISLSVVAAVVIAVATIYVSSSGIINKTYDVPLEQITVVADSVSIAEGNRLTKTRGCTSCHGANLEGMLYYDEPFVARFVSPDLTHEVEEYSDAELARIIRHGVTPRGTSTLAMPSPTFYHLSDRDVGSILAYLRSLPPAHGPDEEIKLRLLARIAFLTGEFVPQAATIDHSSPRLKVEPDDPYSFGEYLAKTSCSECHGHNLQGQAEGQVITPDLAIVQSYSDSAFIELMTKGKALGGRELKTMSSVARTRFSHFTDRELIALYAYLSGNRSPQ